MSNVVPIRKKIPAECRYCGEQLSLGAMRFWLDACEKLGEDPVEYALRLGGAICSKCEIRRASEILEDDEGGVGDRFLSRLRRIAFGIESVK